MTLQASQLAHARGPRRLFSDLSFEAGPGEAWQVRGRNGSGKTTLLRLLCGLVQPLAGEVRWRGQPIRREREALGRDLLYIGHAAALKDEFSAHENLCFASRLAGRGCTPREATDALAAVGLADRAHLPARALSQGQRRRVGLARLALPITSRGTPDGASLLILDEPFVALDGEALAATTALIEGHLAQGATLVYTTHQSQPFRAARHACIDLDAGDAAARVQRDQAKAG